MSPCKNIIYLECLEGDDCEGDLCDFHPHDYIRCREFRNLSMRDTRWMLNQEWIWVYTEDRNEKWYCKECHHRFRRNPPTKKNKIEK